jgi:hypothetical protein
MSKLELKAAMESLQVKLQSKQPQFKAPPTLPENTSVPGETQVGMGTSVVESTPVPAQTMVPETTLVAAQTLVAPETKVARETTVPVATSVVVETQAVTSTQVLTQTMVHGETPVDTDTKVPVQTQVSTATVVPPETQVATRTPVARATKANSSDAASDQDSSVTLEAESAPKLQQGYTRIPNRILMHMANGELHRSEMQILLLIARFTISFQRRHAPLSKSVLERQSGLRGPAVLQAISNLVVKGLVEKIPGDQHRPNLLGLVFDDEWEFFPKKKTQVSTVTTVPPTTQVPAQTTVDVGTTASVAVQTPAVVAGATYFKDIETIENKNSLSELPEKLREYFDKLKPAKKRESEWKAFQELKKDYSAVDIVDCLALLQERGIGAGDAAQPCHSPMAFLSKAMSETLQVVSAERDKAKNRAEREKREAEIKRQQVEADAREVEEWAAKEIAFKKAFPSEEGQHEALSDLLRNLPFKATTQAGRIFGIGRWWDGLNEYERGELME